MPATATIAAVPDRATAVAARILARQLQCGKCGHVAPSWDFYDGRGRQCGEHPEHRYCPSCHQSITYYGATRVNS